MARKRRNKRTNYLLAKFGGLLHRPRFARGCRRSTTRRRSTIPRSTRSIHVVAARRSTFSGTSTSCFRSTCRELDLSMLLSQHRDADILLEVARHMGFEFVRGSTFGGGTSTLRELMDRSQSMNLAITPDGPRGPRRTLAQTIYLSSKLGMPLVAMGFGYSNPWRLGSCGACHSQALLARTHLRQPGDGRSRTSVAIRWNTTAWKSRPCSIA